MLKDSEQKSAGLQREFDKLSSAFSTLQRENEENLAKVRIAEDKVTRLTAEV